LRPVEEQGYVVVAINSPQVDYVRCATMLAQSLRQFHSSARVCLITDQTVVDSVFDHVQVVTPHADPYANDYSAFKLSPFRETIKLEADMLIASPIDHWWTMLQHRDVVISTGCRDWKDQVSTARNYRAVFDHNNLPDVYNAITYWRLSPTAKEFFDLTKEIFNNWTEFRQLIKFSPDTPDTDLVYAMATEIMGRERCTMPFATYPQIVHMKRHIAGTRTEKWTHELPWELNPLRVNTVAQWGAFHYNLKAWQP
jgi:hypothetical protein